MNIYYKKQEKTLIDVENLKQELQKDFFDKDNKETITYSNKDINNLLIKADDYILNNKNILHI